MMIYDPVMKLLMVRHAKAQDREKWALQGHDDFSRPLTDIGMQEFSDIAELLAKAVENVHCIVTSPARRTRQTADILSEKWGGVTIKESDALLQSTPIKDVNKLLKKRLQDDGVLVIVGHENHFSEILSCLLTVDDSYCVRFKKGGAALIEVEVSGSEVIGQLRWMTTPKLLRSIM